MQPLVAVAFFAVTLILGLTHRIRRDASGRVDTRYFSQLGYTFAAGILLLALGLLAGLRADHPYISLVGLSSTYFGAYALVLFAYSFPLNRPAPRALHAALLALTVATVALGIHRGVGGNRADPVWLHLTMVPYLGLTVFYTQRNWRAAIAPDERRPNLPVTLVQLSVLAPWVVSFVAYGAVSARVSEPPPWLYLTQELGLALVVVGGVGAAVLRYHLFDIRVLLAEALVAVGAAALFGAYVGLVAPPLHAFVDHALSPDLATVVVAGIPLLLGYAVVGARGAADSAGRRVDTRQGIVEQAIASTAKLVEPGAVLALVAATIYRADRCEVRFLRAGPVAPEEYDEVDPELVALINAHPKRFYTTDHLPELPADLGAWIDRLDAGVLVPVSRGRAFHGLLVLPRPRPGRPTIHLCAAMAEHLALKFENYALYAETARAARQRDRLSRELEESRRLASLGAFAAAVAHDIRTPLTSIQMNVQIVRGCAGIAEADREYLDIALEEIGRLNRSVSEILEFSRPLNVTTEPVVVSELLSEVARTLAPIYAERGLSLKVTAQRPEPGPVELDVTRLRKLLVNLLDNAASASEPGATVELESYRVGTSLKIAVKDHGRGIEPENLERIFEPFFTTRADGTGLGLAIALKIVKAHGGDIEVESEVGYGTTFTITLPAGRAEIAAAATEVSAPAS